ncbi:MAG TPA: M23 family metallopeptidase [Myxococcaceae bacterium]|nr:M23 family metallopeptidase [Myxococcaceae bacterium]
MERRAATSAATYLSRVATRNGTRASGAKSSRTPHPAKRSQRPVLALMVAVSPLLLLAGFLGVGALQTPSELEKGAGDLRLGGPAVRMLGPEWEAPAAMAATAPTTPAAITAPVPRAEPTPTDGVFPSAWESRAATLGRSATVNTVTTETAAPAASPPSSELPAYPPTRAGSVPRRLLMTWPIESQAITSKFGGRVDPVDHVGRQHHNGVDIGAVTGTPVVAAAPGRVVFASRTPGSGLVIKIAHNPTLISQYRHLASMRVRVGDHVQMGQRIGLSGATGRTTGPHLHFEIWENGRPQNPFNYAWAEFNERDTAARMYATSRAAEGAEPLAPPASN